MFKNIQIKIVLIIFLIGMIIIGGLGAFFIHSLNMLVANINIEQGMQMEQVIVEVNQMQYNTKIILAVSIALFIVVGILIFIFLSKFVILPINKLIKSAEKITEEEKKENKKIKENERKGKKTKEKKKKGNVDNLENVFGMVTTELKEKLSEVSTQKKQIETILLHMTDGIIAFNVQGEIMLLNPAAKKLLSIKPEDSKFDDIFGKFNLNINLEKIIYLENWTSTEQRIQVDDIYVNAFFAPFKDEDDRPNGVIAVIQDVTEHVKLDNMQKELVADVSHELKTPITSIMGYADTLLEGEYDKETQDKFLKVIATEARRMAKLVANDMGIGLDEIVALGDNENDLSMLKEVIYSVAMENAKDIVKDQVRYVARSNEESGVAKFLNLFLKLD